MLGGKFFAPQSGTATNLFCGECEQFGVGGKFLLVDATGFGLVSRAHTMNALSKRGPVDKDVEHHAKISLCFSFPHVNCIETAHPKLSDEVQSRLPFEVVPGVNSQPPIPGSHSTRGGAEVVRCSRKHQHNLVVRALGFGWLEKPVALMFHMV